MVFRISKNPMEYMIRHGIVSEHARPSPRLNVSALLVHTIPLHPPKPAQPVLCQLEGDPSPDRGGVIPWAAQREQL